MQKKQAIKGHIPQDGKKLRELRKAASQNQTELADRLLDFLKPHMRPGFLLQQHDIARLELENTPMDVAELLGYSHLFGVDIDHLLKPHFRSLHKSAFRLQQFLLDDEADNYLCELENAGRILVYSQFPSSFFIHPPQDSVRFQQIARLDYQETHFHTLDSLLNFIFSPISRYSYAERDVILTRYLEHFRHKHSKRLQFFSRAAFTPDSLFPNLVLLPEKSTLLMLAPIMRHTQGDVFLEVHDEAICGQVREFYFHQVNTLDADITLLKIGRETLELLQEGENMESAIQFFHAETLKRSPEDSKTILENFRPDLREMLGE